MFKRHKIQLLGISIFFVFYACGSAGDDGGPREGEGGKVKFSGGGGCNNSTTLAVGSRATLTMESADGTALPANLAVSSSQPATITAGHGSKQHRVEVAAVQAGSTYLEVMDGNKLWDRVRFTAEPATAVMLDSPATRVLAGATLALKLGEVHGSCGKNCPLIGGGFLGWSASPANGLTLHSDRERTATFSAGKTAGKVTLSGREPVTGHALVNHSIEIVPTAEVAALEAEAVVSLAQVKGQESRVLDPAPMPLSMPAGSLMMLRLHAKTKDGQKVPVWGRDVKWVIEGDKGVARPLYMEGDTTPAEGPIFTTTAAGQVTLVGNVGLLARTIRVKLIVSAAP